jgi:glycosyltransferase involved in cell wall biosynthesis
MTGPVKLAYLVSHPIQYQAPMLRRIAADPGIDLTVFFCSASSMRPHRDEGFGRVIEWDVPLTEGYAHEFLPALGDTGSPGRLRPVNWGLMARLRAGGFDALWTHGWMRPYNLLVMARARSAGLVVLNRDESWEHASAPGAAKRALRGAMFAAARRVCDGWLAIGENNRRFCVAQGVAAERIFPMPYAVDNDRFRTMAADAAPTRDALRDELGIAPGRPVVLFAAKFQPRKRAGLLMEAFARVANDPACRAPCLVMVGDGEDRDALQARAAQPDLSDAVRFAGFRNQSELPRFYDLCDAFVLPSVLEPWGLAVNEAMCAGRAMIVSDQVGAAADLVHDGENGFVTKADDADALAGALRAVLSDPDRCAAMGRRSAEIIAGWGFEEDLTGLKQALRHFMAERAR